jgi:ferredoxin--NADP+ reductase
MSMIRGELGFQPDGRLNRLALWQCNGSRHFVIVHGARHSWDLGYRTDLTGLARRCSNVHYLPLITRPHEDQSWRGRNGYLQDYIRSGALKRDTGLELTPDDFDIFLCGNPGMIDSVVEWTQARGFTPDRGQEIGNLHAEHYW